MNNVAYSFNPEDYRQAYAELLKKDLFSLAHHLGYTEITWETHGPICIALESESKRKLITVPRGCFKSTISSVLYPIQILNNNPNARILIDSELYTNSKNFLREIKGHLESEVLTSLYGEYRTSLWNEAEINIRQRTKVRKEASITVSGVGAQKTSQHYDYIIADDLNSPKNSMTPEGLQKVIDHYKMYVSLLEPNGTIVVVGTRYSTNDIIGFILENELGLQSGDVPKTNVVIPKLK